MAQEEQLACEGAYRMLEAAKAIERAMVLVRHTDRTDMLMDRLERAASNYRYDAARLVRRAATGW